MAPKFKVGDRVIVKVAEFVKRVGYPKTVADFEPEAERILADKNLIRKSYNPRLVLSDYSKFEMKLISSYARVLLDRDCYGGNERSIHTLEKPEFLNREFSVSNKKVVKTGVYTHATSYTSYYGETDYRPAFLDNEKTHILLRLYPSHLPEGYKDGPFPLQPHTYNLVIDSCNVVKI